tara:strand:- start:656 stop:805 length:150 start_codon:yes stop_codon:yes gene_type:complete
MKKYKLTDTSKIYECEVIANSEEEAIEKAKNWQEVSSHCRDIEVEEVDQ